MSESPVLFYNRANGQWATGVMLPDATYRQTFVSIPPQMTTMLRIGKIAAAAGVAATALLGASGTALAVSTTDAPAAASASTGVILRPTVSQDRALTVTAPGQFGPALGAVTLSGPPGATQRWNLVPAGTGLVTIENNVFGRLCVRADPNPNVDVISPAPCDGSTAQKWDIQPTAGGQRIKNAAAGQVMSGNVSQVLPFAIVFEEPPASSTPSKFKQAWKIGS